MRQKKMAQKNKIDNLFREGLSSLEVAPTTDAWHQVESQIAPNRLGYRMMIGIAATVTILLISITLILIQPSHEQKTMIAGESPLAGAPPPAAAAAEQRTANLFR